MNDVTSPCSVHAFQLQSITKILEDHETRMRRVERFLVVLSPIASALAAFVGAYLKP